MLNIDKKYWICVLIDVAIIAIIPILSFGFHIDLSNYIILIGFIFILSLPWYFVIKGTKKIEESRLSNTLSEEIEDIENSLEEMNTYIEDCRKRLLSVKDYSSFKEEMRTKVREIENFDEELTAFECLDACLGEVESISNNLNVIKIQVKD